MTKNIHKNTLIGAVLVAASSLVAPAFSDTYEERLEVANAYSVMAVEDLDMKALITQMYAPILDQIQTQRSITFSDEQVAQVHSLYMETFETPMTELTLGQANIMAEIMSLEELQAIHAFYSSDTGRSVMQKLPEIIGRNQPVILEMVQSKMPSVMQSLGSILELN